VIHRRDRFDDPSRRCVTVEVLPPQPGSTIDNYQDGRWWALVTCTTVGYGDHFPLTGGGRIVAVVLMIVGIAVLSMLTAMNQAEATR